MFNIKLITMKSTKIMYFLLAMFLSIGFVACTEEDDESCDGEDIAEDLGCPTDVNVIATFCSDGVNNSYYTYNGVDYECEGVEASTCDSALVAIAIQVIEDNPDCLTKKAGNMERATVKLTTMAEVLLEEVRAKSLIE